MAIQLPNDATRGGVDNEVIEVERSSDTELNAAAKGMQVTSPRMKQRR